MKEAKRDWYLYQKRADFSELSEKLGIDPVLSLIHISEPTRH